MGRHGGRSESSRSSIDSGAPEFYIGGLTVTSNTAPNPNNNINGDFDWEAVDKRIDRRELSIFFGAEADDDAYVLPGIPPANQQQQPSEEEEVEEEDRDGLEWEVLLTFKTMRVGVEREKGGIFVF